jgi:hypothetical protein
MLVRCPECSVAREVEPQNGASKSGASDVCERCGYSALASSAAGGADARDPSSFAGARAKLKNATQDLFRLSGNYSLPAEARVVSEPVAAPVKAPEAIPASGRQAEASIMFSLEELMKANNHPVSIKHDEAPDALWEMQAATPLFGTAHDQALLTTPLKLEQSSSMDPMTVPSRPPTARRWLSIVLAVGGLGVAVAGVSWYAHGAAQLKASAASELAASKSSEQTASGAVVADGPGAAERAAGDQPGGDKAAVDDATAVAAAAPSVTAEVPPPVTPDPGEAAASATATPAASDVTQPGEARVQKNELARGKSAAKKSSQRSIFPSSTQKAFPFDMGAAKKALNAAAAASAACGQGGAPGKGKVQLTFAPSGRVSNADLVEGAFGGSSAGKCALRNFRAARVPAFSGAPVTVAKSFSVL